MSTHGSTRRRSAAALLLSLLVLVAGCGDATESAPGPRFSIQPPIATMVVGQQRDVGVAWEGGVPSDAQASWVVRPDSIVRIVAASTWGATLQARQAGTALVTLTVTSQGRAASRDMVLTVDPLVCALIGPAVTPSNVTLAVGGRAQVAASRVPPPPCGPPDGSVDFRMLDTSVATVDADGWVTGRRIGTTALIVSPRGNPGLSTAIGVSVVPSGGPPLSIAVTPSAVDVLVADTVRLRGVVSRGPNGPGSSTEVRFSSADTAIATVDASGLLRGVRAGQTFVRATAVADTSFWAAVPVTVRAR